MTWGSLISPGYVEKRIRLPDGAELITVSRYSFIVEWPNLQKDPPKKHTSLGPSSSRKTEETYSGEGISAAPVMVLWLQYTHLPLHPPKGKKKGSFFIEPTGLMFKPNLNNPPRSTQATVQPKQKNQLCFQSFPWIQRCESRIGRLFCD